MLQTNWGVKITLKTLYSNDADIGLSNDGTRSYFKWKLRNSSDFTSYVSGILLDKWVSDITKSVDIKRYAKTASVGSGTVYIDNAADIFEDFNTIGVDLYGSMIQIMHLEGTTETIEFTGIIGEVLSSSDTVEIPFEEISNYRKVNVSMVSDNPEVYYPVVFGEVDKVKFLNTANEAQEIVLSTGEELLFQIYANSSTLSELGYSFEIKCNRELTDGEYIEIQTAIYIGNKGYARDVYNGSDATRRISVFSRKPTGGDDEFTLELFDSVYIDTDDLPEWKNYTDDDAECTYIKLYSSYNVNYADIWSNCLGYQGSNIFAYKDGFYLNLPVFGGAGFIQNPNNIEIKSNAPSDFGSITGYYAITPTSFDSITPTDYVGLDDYTWSYNDGIVSDTVYTDSSTAFTNGLFEAVRSGAFSDTYDKDLDTAYSIADNVCYIGDNDQYHLMKAYSVGFDSSNVPLSINKVFVSFKLYHNTNKLSGVSLLTFDYDMIVNGKNTFVNTELSRTTVGSAHYINNIDNSYLPQTFLNDNLDYSKTWQYQRWYTNLYSNPTDGNRYATGYELLEVDYSSTPMPKANYNINIGIQTTVHAFGASPVIYNYLLDIYEIALFGEITGIDITGGLYASWYGRQFATTYFGSDTDDLIRNGKDVYNHICRLQNFTTNNLTPPTLGWGFDYLDNEDDYDNVIDNSTDYGGLQNANYSDIICDFQLTSGNDTVIDKMKSNLCQYMWCMGTVDSTGIEKLYPLQNAFDGGLEITYFDIIAGSESDIKPLSKDDIFCKPVINYNYDEASSKYLGQIKIEGIEFDTYSSAYVTGITDSNDAEATWNLARSLFVKYSVINENPNQLTNLRYIKDYDSALLYLTNWLYWQGAGPVEAEIGHRQISFVVPYEFCYTNSIDLGTLVSMDFPLFPVNNVGNGIVTGITKNFKNENPTYKLTVLFKLVDTSDMFEETGSADTDINETGSQSDDISEV